jgi:hypothetical protein
MDNPFIHSPHHRRERWRVLPLPAGVGKRNQAGIGGEAAVGHGGRF